ncbi:MAG TPA: hypothetical protein VH187_05660 [Scandinavium sp.]|jgi:hypothetical protein|uniref:hypothetical protein n=1 Tax=Scandinavium sp. TaxID=2830653 RepID=UPI002E377C68|nr:hypothetical protein [Scandinavium sp.]HEX4500646.1 hypothetical protein [Scandinavium sp.]
MAKSVHAEIVEVRRALVGAVEVAVESYLVGQAGEDLPESQMALDNYDFEVQRGLTRTTFMIRCKHKEGTYPSLHFEVKVSGG